MSLQNAAGCHCEWAVPTLGCQFLLYNDQCESIITIFNGNSFSALDSHLHISIQEETIHILQWNFIESESRDG